ncbi:MAG: type II CAAX endopeptidase family protein [Balneolaceae bacterium]
MFTKIFYNPVEERLRAGWRILIFTSLLMVLGVALNTISVSSLFFTIGLAVMVLISLWLAADFLDNRSFKEYGFSLAADWFRDLFTGVFIAAVSMGIIFIILFTFGWITIINTSFSLSAELVSYLIFMMAVSIWEEGFFRSYLILNIKEGAQSAWISNRWALIFAVSISSLFFSLGHLANPGATYLSAFNIFVAGAVLAYPFIATGSIGLSVGLHLSWNYFQSAVFGLPVSGNQFNQGIIQSNINGSHLFTGGEFGPEGGIIGFIGLIVMIIFTHIYVILRKRTLQNRF